MTTLSRSFMAAENSQILPVCPLPILIDRWLTMEWEKSSTKCKNTNLQLEVSSKLEKFDNQS